jgi:membrane protease YdiL (CAAX protease family)
MASSGDEEEREVTSGPTEDAQGQWSTRPSRPGRPTPSPGPSAVPRSRADAGWWVVFAAIGFVVGQVVALVVVDVAAAITGNGSRLSTIERLTAPPAWYIVAGLVGLWVGFLVGPILASRVAGTRHVLADMGVSFRPIDLLGVAIGLGGQLLVTLIYLPFVSHLKNFEGPTTKLTGGAHGGSFALIAVMTVLGAPFFEELFFRGVLFKGLLGILGVTGSRRARGGTRVAAVVVAVVVDGLLFGLAHAELEQLAGLAIFGCILAVVAFRTGRLGMNMTAHATFNLVAVIAIASNRAVLVH